MRTLGNYLKKIYPEEDIDVLLNSFTWRIPAPPADQVEETPNDENRRASNQQSSGTLALLESDVELGHSTNSASNTSGKRKKQRKLSHPHTYVSSMNGVLTISHDPIDVDPIVFHKYLNSMDNLLEESSSGTVSASSPLMVYEWAEASTKISSLLKKGFPALFVSKDAVELAALASKLSKDPNLSTEKTQMLNLMEEIPVISKEFQANKAVMEEADRFFSVLELNKAKAESLKKEYIDLENKLVSIQIEVDKNLEEFQMIEARKSALTKSIESKMKEMVDLSYGMKIVANSIPIKVVEVQAANSEKPEWELKMENALKCEKDILSKVTPLKSFSLKDIKIVINNYVMSNF